MAVKLAHKLHKGLLGAEYRQSMLTFQVQVDLQRRTRTQTDNESAQPMNFLKSQLTLAWNDLFPKGVNFLTCATTTSIYPLSFPQSFLAHNHKQHLIILFIWQCTSLWALLDHRMLVAVFLQLPGGGLQKGFLGAFQISDHRNAEK